MREAVIVSIARTPIGKAYRGAFNDTDAPVLAAHCVNQALARKYFPGRDPLGRHVWLENQRDPYEIVGVAGDAKYNDVRLPSPPIVYQFALMSRGSSDLSLRTSGRRAGLADDARRLVNDVFGTNSVGRVTTLAEQVDASIVPERLLAALAGFFGAVGALLAAIGLFGSLAYAVTRQTREIGIRMALGARKGDVMALPSWALCEHANTASEDAVLFSIRDRPVMEALGFYREEALLENGGHQEVVGVFSPE